MKRYVAILFLIAIIIAVGWYASLKFSENRVNSTETNTVTDLEAVPTYVDDQLEVTYPKELRLALQEYDNKEGAFTYFIQTSDVANDSTKYTDYAPALESEQLSMSISIVKANQGIIDMYQASEKFTIGDYQYAELELAKIDPDSNYKIYSLVIDEVYVEVGFNDNTVYSVEDIMRSIEFKL